MKTLSLFFVILINLLISVISIFGLSYVYFQIKRSFSQIMSNQDQFNEKINQANQALDNISAAIEAERQQIAEFIEAHPEIDTSALDDVVERMSGMSNSVFGIFQPESPAEEPVSEEDPVEEDSEVEDENPE